MNRGDVMELGGVALGLTISAFAVQGLVIAVAGSVGRTMRELNFLPFVEFSFLAASALVVIAGGWASPSPLLSAVGFVTFALLVVFILLQALRTAFLGFVARQIQANRTTMDAGRSRDDPVEEQNGEQGEEIGDDDVAPNELPETRCVPVKVEDQSSVPAAKELSTAFTGFFTRYAYGFFIDVSLGTNENGDPLATVTAESIGVEITWTDTYVLGAQLARGLFGRAFLNPLPLNLIGVETPAFRLFRRLSALLNIEIETVAQARDTAKGSVTCRRSEDGKCIITATTLVTPPVNTGPFSAAAIVNVRPVLVGGSTDRNLPDEVILDCQGVAAFNGRLAVRKVTLGGTLGAELTTPVKLTPSGTIEVVIEPQDVDDQLPAGRVLRYRCESVARDA